MWARGEYGDGRLATFMARSINAANKENFPNGISSFDLTALKNFIGMENIEPTKENIFKK